MTQSLVEMATEIVITQVRQGTVRIAGVQELLRTTFETLRAVHDASPAPAPDTTVQTLTWEKSRGKDARICLECRARYTVLSGLHLSRHGLDVAGYKAKYGIPPSQKLTSMTLRRLHRRIAQSVRPWDKRRHRQAKKQSAKSEKNAPKSTARRKKNVQGCQRASLTVNRALWAEARLPNGATGMYGLCV